MFAGHDQCGGEVVTKQDGKKVKLFYGMSSSTAMLKHSGGVAEYRSSEGKNSKLPKILSIVPVAFESTDNPKHMLHNITPIQNRKYLRYSLQHINTRLSLREVTNIGNRAET